MPADSHLPNPAFMQQAIDLATGNVTDTCGGPFGAVIARGEVVIATGVNRVTATSDPTAHAEVTAIRNACAALHTFELRGCQIYTSCEPCPMCLAAIYWARLDTIYFGNSAADAARAGFDDAVIYAEVARPHNARSVPILPLLSEQAWVSFDTWIKSGCKVDY